MDKSLPGVNANSSQFFYDLDRDLDNNLYELFLNESAALGCGPGAAGEEDALYQERLQSLIDRQLHEIKSFALKEGRDSAEVRRAVATNHARILFSPAERKAPLLSFNQNPASDSGSQPTNSPLISFLRSISDALEKIHAVFSLDSLLLAVSPGDSSSEGWLGGSEVGREFWRGLRGGGSSGARAFKTLSMSSYEASRYLPEDQISAGDTISTNNPRRMDTAATMTAPPAVNKPMTSQTIESELNRAMRSALSRFDTLSSLPVISREASGVRNAEMKWTKPQSLESTYGVKLVGWPNGVVLQNPSSNTVDVNRTLLEAVKDGRIKFVRPNAESSIDASLEAFTGYAPCQP